MNFNLVNMRVIIFLCFLSIMMSGIDIFDVLIKRKNIISTVLYSNSKDNRSSIKNIKKTQNIKENKYQKNIINNLKVNINSAELEELCKLPGIGKIIAKRIIFLRKKEKFVQVEDLLKIKGIGLSKLSKIRKYVCFKLFN